jgi:hypothetical protein
VLDGEVDRAAFTLPGLVAGLAGVSGRAIAWPAFPADQSALQVVIRQLITT